MKLNLKTLTACSLLLAAITGAHAQYAPPPPPVPFPGFINDYMRKQDPYNSVWDIGGAVRVRYEMKEGGLGLPPANDFRAITTGTTRNNNEFLSSKILARVSYTEKWWSVYVEGRSSETWGDARSNTGAGAVPESGGGNGPETDGPADLHQAYFTLGNHKEFPLSLKVGRQELSYGDERLVGAFAWNNIGRVFDAAKVRWQNSLFSADAFVSKVVLPDDNQLNTWNDYNVFSGVHLSTKKIPKTLTEVYFFARNEEVGVATAQAGAVLPFQTAAPAARDIYTLGARFKSNPGDFGSFDYTIEGAYQFGDWQGAVNGAHLDHKAYAFMANVGYTIPETSTMPRFALEYAFGSGDSDPGDGNHETFDNLYPTNHKFYGYMDFLSWQNLHDVRAIFSIKPTPRLSVSLEGHMFWAADTADNIYNAGGVARGAGATAGTGFGRNPSYDSKLGSEVDLVAGYALNKFTALEAGYGHFFVGDYIKQTWSSPATGAKDADWFYVQAVVRF
jgi:hypothetical protein